MKVISARQVWHDALHENRASALAVAAEQAALGKKGGSGDVKIMVMLENHDGQEVCKVYEVRKEGVQETRPGRRLTNDRCAHMLTAGLVLQAIDSLPKSLRHLGNFLYSPVASGKRISIQELDDALQQGDESRIEELLALGLFALLALRLRAIYTRGATKELEGIRVPGIRKEIDPSAPSVNGFLSGQSSTIQKQAQAEQIAAIRAAIAAGAIRGDSTRAIALNIAGRISRQTGVRSGGVVGLSGAAAKAVESARDQLASGDPAQLKEYLKRARRDRAFDSVVKASIETGKPIAQATINRAAGSYAERLLTTQAETIAQTNTAEAYYKGREEGWRQLSKQP